MKDKTTFSDLINDLSGRIDKSQDSTRNFMRGLVSIIEGGLRTTGSVTISGFGKFELRWVEERKGINPQTQEEITIPGQNKIIFKPYKALREHVNRPYAQMEAQILDDSPQNKEKDGPAPPAEQKNEPEKDGAREIYDLFEPDETDVDKIRNKTTDPGKGKKEEVPYPFFIDEEGEADDPDEELLIIKPSPVGNQQTPSKFSKSKPLPDKKPLEKSSFHWSYAALGAAVLLVVIATFFYFLPDERESVDLVNIEPPALESPPPVTDEPNRIDSEETDLIAIMIENGQNLWELALEHLGDPYLWPWIFHINSEIIEDPNVITRGTTLNVPVPDDNENLSDEDLQEVAYGYISVYNWYTEQNTDEARNYLWAAGSFYPPVLDEIENDVNADDLRFARSR